MQNKELWKSYQDYTAQASQTIRWLCGIFLGYAFFKVEGNLPFLLLFPLFMVFFLDLLQHIIAALTLRIWTLKKEGEYYKKYGSIYRNKNEEHIDYEKPQWLDKTPFIFWILKIVLFAFAAYMFFCILYTQGTTSI